MINMHTIKRGTREEENISKLSNIVEYYSKTSNNIYSSFDILSLFGQTLPQGSGSAIILHPNISLFPKTTVGLSKDNTQIG